MLRVLVVDDSETFRMLVQQHIRSAWPQAQLSGYDPVTMAPLAENFDGSEYDLVLLDYQLGEQNGFDYLKRFRKIPGFPPVVMMTAGGDERLAVEAIKLGASDYVPKRQIQHGVLINAMREALDARGAVERYKESHAVTRERQVRIKGLRMLRLLGEGGMSAVYLAQRERNGERIVVKLFDQAKAEGQDASAMARFFQEYEILRKLSHPGIVRIFEQGFTDDCAYIAMEYFPDGSLRERLNGALEPAQALDHLRQIGDALEAVHGAQVVHRDLKPANVMFRGDGRLALIDFGVARSESEALHLTRAGLAIGTPHYMSPEQADGLRPDARSDLYSLGVLFYEMLTGCVPYSARTALAVMYKHKHAPVPELPAALAPLQPLVHRLLAKAPGERYPSVRELRAALAALSPPGHVLKFSNH